MERPNPLNIPLYGSIAFAVAFLAHTTIDRSLASLRAHLNSVTLSVETVEPCLAESNLERDMTVQPHTHPAFEDLTSCLRDNTPSLPPKILSVQIASNGTTYKIKPDIPPPQVCPYSNRVHCR